MVIVIAITAISEMIFNVNDVSNVIKLWRLLFMVIASISGMIGVFISFILLIAEITSINSFGVPYLYPTAPFYKVDQGNDIVLNEKYKMSIRNMLTANKNRIRGTLITDFNIESDLVDKVPSRSTKCQYIIAQIEKLMRGYL